MSETKNEMPNEEYKKFEKLEFFPINTTNTKFIGDATCSSEYAVNKESTRLFSKEKRKIKICTLSGELYLFVKTPKNIIKTIIYLKDNHKFSSEGSMTGTVNEQTYFLKVDIKNDKQIVPKSKYKKNLSYTFTFNNHNDYSSLKTYINDNKNTTGGKKKYTTKSNKKCSVKTKAGTKCKKLVNKSAKKCHLHSCK